MQNETRRYLRDKRIMKFTSLLRLLNKVSHARVEQCHTLFLKYEKKNPLDDILSSQDDHQKMREFIEKGD